MLWGYTAELAASCFAQLDTKGPHEAIWCLPLFNGFRLTGLTAIRQYDPGPQEGSCYQAWNGVLRLYMLFCSISLSVWAAFVQFALSDRLRSLLSINQSRTRKDTWKFNPLGAKNTNGQHWAGKQGVVDIDAWLQLVWVERPFSVRGLQLLHRAASWLPIV